MERRMPGGIFEELEVLFGYILDGAGRVSKRFLKQPLGDAFIIPSNSRSPFHRESF